MENSDETQENSEIDASKVDPFAVDPFAVDPFAVDPFKVDPFKADCATTFGTVLEAKSKFKLGRLNIQVEDEDEEDPDVEDIKEKEITSNNKTVCLNDDLTNLKEVFDEELCTSLLVGWYEACSKYTVNICRQICSYH